MKRDDDLFQPPIGGQGKTIEADGTYVGRKPDTKVRPGAGHMNPVFSLVERDGSVRSFHMPNVRGENLRAKLAIHADRADLRRCRLSRTTRSRCQHRPLGV
jgi:hypothetical protein